jgi:hypothetical protein
VRAPLELRGGAHREDLEHRLDQRSVLDRLPRDDRDDSRDPPGCVLQRVAGIADRALGQVLVLREELGHVARNHREVSAHHRAAGRGVEPVLEVLSVGAAAVEAEGADGVRRLAEEAPDQRELHVQDRGEVARELLEHAIALGARDRERGGVQDVVWWLTGAVYALSDARPCDYLAGYH